MKNILTFKHYTSANGIIGILSESKLKTKNTLDEMNDLLEKQLLTRLLDVKLYGFCFSLRKRESLPMWKMYAEKGCMLLISLKPNTTYEAFIKNFSSQVTKGRIIYKNDKSFKSLIDNPSTIGKDEKYLIKSSYFDFENEYRFVMNEPEINIDFNKLSKIIVYYSPDISYEDYSKIDELIKKINKTKNLNIKLEKSKIAEVYQRKER